jgi:hypothetical protein
MSLCYPSEVNRNCLARNMVEEQANAHSLHSPSSTCSLSLHSCLQHRFLKVRYCSMLVAAPSNVVANRCADRRDDTVIKIFPSQSTTSSPVTYLYTQSLSSSHACNRYGRVKTETLTACSNGRSDPVGCYETSDCPHGPRIVPRRHNGRRTISHA